MDFSVTRLLLELGEHLTELFFVQSFRLPSQELNVLSYLLCHCRRHTRGVVNHLMLFQKFTIGIWYVANDCYENICSLHSSYIAIYVCVVIR